MRTRSSKPAGAIYLDREGRIAELRRAARRAAGRMPSIRRVLLFGSLVSGIPTPRSDADLLVIVETSEHAQPRDRIPELLQALAPLPCPVDLFVLTAKETEAPAARNAPLVRLALSSGVDLLEPRGAG